MSRFLHVANGTSTTRLIGAAGIPGTCSIWADPLHDGPVPGRVSDDDLLEVRAGHLRSTGPANVDPVNDLRRWRAAIEAHQTYEELVLWFEHDLFDQLNLVQLLTWVRERLPPAHRVSLVCVGSYPGHPHFKGLGELSPRELEPLFGTRQPVSHVQYSLAARAWQAFREPTPEPLDALHRGDTSALPFLAPAIGRFLEEYPATVDGLSRTERTLLQVAHGRPIELLDAFARMHEREDAYYVTDSSLVDLAASLSRTAPPLLTWSRSGASHAGPLQGSVALTDFGRAVLAGHADRVATCGVDRWLGGVHLEGRACPWRWDTARRRISRA